MPCACFPRGFSLFLAYCLNLYQWPFKRLAEIQSDTINRYFAYTWQTCKVRMRMLACWPCEWKLCHAKVFLASSGSVLNQRTAQKAQLLSCFEHLLLIVAPMLNTTQARWLLYSWSGWANTERENTEENFSLRSCRRSWSDLGRGLVPADPQTRVLSTWQSPISPSDPPKSPEVTFIFNLASKFCKEDLQNKQVFGKQYAYCICLGTFWSSHRLPAKQMQGGAFDSFTREECGQVRMSPATWLCLHARITEVGTSSAGRSTCFNWGSAQRKRVWFIYRGLLRPVFQGKQCLFGCPSSPLQAAVICQPDSTTSERTVEVSEMLSLCLSE